MGVVLIIIIENCKNQTISGYLKSLYQKKTVCCNGLDHMLLLIKDILDREEIQAESGERCLNARKSIFAVTVHSRQNTSIRGVIRNSEGCGMEVLRMICECLSA